MSAIKYRSSPATRPEEQTTPQSSSPFSSLRRFWPSARQTGTVPTSKKARHSGESSPAATTTPQQQGTPCAAPSLIASVSAASARAAAAASGLRSPRVPRATGAGTDDQDVSSARRNLATEFEAQAGTTGASAAAQQVRPSTPSKLFGLFSPMFSIFLGRQRVEQQMLQQAEAEAQQQREAEAQAALALAQAASRQPLAKVGDEDQTMVATASIVIAPPPEQQTQQGTPGAVGASTIAQPPRRNSNVVAVEDGLDDDDADYDAASRRRRQGQGQATTTAAAEDGSSAMDWEQGAAAADGDDDADDACCDEDEDDESNPYTFVRRLPYLPRVQPAFSCAIPPKAPGAPRPTLVLDLDETLVHCSTEPVSGADMVFPVVWNGVEYRVYARRRPGLEEFMEAVSQLFEIVVFTASQQVYADKLLDIIDPQRRWFRHRVFRDACVCVEGNYLKDLTILGRDLARTVIIDNSPQAFGFQYNNGVPILSWFDAPDDRELAKLLPLLRTLAAVPDVRPILRQHFKIYKRIEQPQRQRN